MTNTKERHLEILAAADETIKSVGGIGLIDALVDDERLPLLRAMANDISGKTNCTRDTARRNVAKAMRRARFGIMKEQAPEVVIKAIRKILSGQLYVSEKMAEKMMNRLVGHRFAADASAIDCLSDRELEVLLLIGKGHGTRQIADHLRLSIKTIESYRAHIKEKLNLCDAAELLRYAIQCIKT